MFAKLFAESGLSLDRLRTLVEVGAAGSMVKAAGADPVRQSQYSRQIKELEEFFRTRLLQRQRKGTRLTVRGKELARISRFFMLGLSNFRRGCLAEEQTFRLGATSSFRQRFLIPALTSAFLEMSGAKFVIETATEQESERRLHELTLDFAVIRNDAVRRPLQTHSLGRWKLGLWTPKGKFGKPAAAVQAFRARRLPLALASGELNGLGLPAFEDGDAALECASFVDAREALEGGNLAALLPDFLARGKGLSSFQRLPVPELDKVEFHFYLVWNSRLLRLNPHAARMRDLLIALLSKQLAAMVRSKG